MYIFIVSNFNWMIFSSLMDHNHDHLVNTTRPLTVRNSLTDSSTLDEKTVLPGETGSHRGNLSWLWYTSMFRDDICSSVEHTHEVHVHARQ